MAGGVASGVGGGRCCGPDAICAHAHTRTSRQPVRTMKSSGPLLVAGAIIYKTGPSRKLWMGRALTVLRRTANTLQSLTRFFRPFLHPIGRRHNNSRRSVLCSRPNSRDMRRPAFLLHPRLYSKRDYIARVPRYVRDRPQSRTAQGGKIQPSPVPECPSRRSAGDAVRKRGGPAGREPRLPKL